MSPTEATGANDAPTVKCISRGGDDANEEFRVRRRVRPSLAATVLRLETDEADLLRDLAEELVSSPTADPKEFCEEAALLSALLPRRVRRQLAAFARHGSREGILIVRGLPLEPDLPPTPADNTTHLGERTVTAAAQAILNSCLGEMVAYEAEGGGRLFQDMVPSRKQINAQTSLSSGVELELHTEQAFSPLKPRWVSLACLRGARDAATYVLNSRTLLMALTPAERKMLKERLWTTLIDASFQVDGRDFLGGDLRGPFPIVEGSEDDPFIRFDQDLDWGISREAEALRQKIVDLYPQLRTSHTLTPGELLLVDNLRVVHGRSPFAARFDGSDRFIVRSFVVSDLSISRHARPGDGRTIAARYS